MGIDYGLGQTNIDKETNIRFGVINQNKLYEWAWEDMYSNGEDMAFKEFKEQVCSEIKSAIESAIDDYTHSASKCVERLDIDEIYDALEIDYEGTGDNPRYHYECNGYNIETHSDGDWFITKSPYYTMCDFCSPCAPGAGYLTSKGNVKSYCLGPEWFDDNKPPYDVYSMDGTVVYKQ